MRPGILMLGRIHLLALAVVELQLTDIHAVVDTMLHLIHAGSRKVAVAVTLPPLDSPLR